MIQWKKVLGLILIIAGIISLFLPILQGIILILAGLALLGNHRLLDWTKKKLKKYMKQ